MMSAAAAAAARARRSCHFAKIGLGGGDLVQQALRRATAAGGACGQWAIGDGIITSTYLEVCLELEIYLPRFVFSQ